MKKLIRVIRWILINGFFLAMMWLTFREREQWASNVVSFMVVLQWIVVAVCLFVIGNDEQKAKFRKTGLSVPRWLDGLIDVGVCLTFAANGWFWSAGAFAATFVVIQTIYSEDEPKPAAESE